MFYKKVKIPFYQQILFIIICEDVEKEKEKINKKIKIDFEGFNFSGYSYAFEKNHIIILNKKYLTDDSFAIGTIAHEAFHITNFIFKRIGIIPDVNNDEAQAYLLSWITEEVYNLFKKSKK